MSRPIVLVLACFLSAPAFAQNVDTTGGGSSGGGLSLRVGTLRPLSGTTINVAGHLAPTVADTYSLGSGSFNWLRVRAKEGWFQLGVYDAAGVSRVGFTYTTGSTYTSAVADSAAAVAHDFDTANALAASGALLERWKNGGTLKASIDKDGSLSAGSVVPRLDASFNSGTGALHWDTVYAYYLSVVFGVNYGAASLPTCNAGTEGRVTRDTLSGVATGNATRLCFCRSDGASVYAWQNLASAGVGTTTTCPN